MGLNKVGYKTKKLLIIIISILAIFIILSFVKDMIVKASVEKGVEFITGLPLRMRSMNVGIIRTLVEIRNLTLFNPRGYTDRVMLYMPEIYVDYNLGAVFKNKIHLEEMRINLREFTVVRNKKGELNLDSLKVVQAQKEGRKPQEKGKVPQIQIDNLELKIGKVIYKDYSGDGVPVVKEFNINIDEKYKNIKDAYSLVSLIIVRSLADAGIANLAKIDIKGLQGTIPGILSSATKIAEQAQETIKKITQKAQLPTQETAESLKKATEELMGKIKLPFGENK